MPHPKEIKPMLAKDNKSENPFAKKDTVLQQKYDGTRVIVIRVGDRIHLMGRSWKNDFAKRYPGIIHELLRHIPSHDYILDCELTFFKKGTTQSSFLTALAKKDTQEGYVAKLMVFDILRYNRDVTQLPLLQRLSLLNKVIPGGLKHIVVVKTVKTPHTFQKVYKGIIDKNGEGVVLKEKESPYVYDSREHWTKVKKDYTEDCIIVGITHGTGKRASTFGALILAQYDKQGKLIVVGKCSGFDDAVAMALYQNIMGMPTAQMYLGNISGIKKMVAPKIVVEVKFMERTVNNQLRHPVFLRVRTDKQPNQCKIQ